MQAGAPDGRERSRAQLERPNHFRFHDGRSGRESFRKLPGDGRESGEEPACPEDESEPRASKMGELRRGAVLGSCQFRGHDCIAGANKEWPR